jgi:hypothetical protein
MKPAEARARIAAIANGPESGDGLAARLVLEQLWRLENRISAVVELCRGAEVVDSVHVLTLLGVPPLEDDPPAT